MVYNIAIKILTVSIVFAWSDGDRTFSPEIHNLSPFVDSLESLEVLGRKESDDIMEERPEKVGAGTSTRI
jgi:hypothetical protein